jgi:hypothetical protein
MTRFQWWLLVIKSWGPTNTLPYVRMVQKMEVLKKHFHETGILIEANSKAGYGWHFQVTRHRKKTWSMVAVLNGRIVTLSKQTGLKRYTNAARKAGMHGSQ